METNRKKLSKYFWDFLILACFMSRVLNFRHDKFFGRLATIFLGLAIIGTWVTYYAESKSNYINLAKKISIQFLNAFLIVWVLWNISNSVKHVNTELTPIILACHIGVGLIIFIDVICYLKLKRIR